MAAASASGIRAGAAYVELSLRDNKLMAGLAKVSAKLKAFGGSISSIGKSMFALSAGGLAAFAGAAKLFADMGSKLNDMSERTGFSVEALSELSFAAEQSGASMEDLDSAIGKMQKTIAGADEESQKAVEALGALEIQVEDLQNLAPEDQFTKMSEAIADIDDPAKRTAAAMEVFGKAGRKLIPMMKDLEALRKGARDSGLVFTREDAEKADAFGDKLDGLWSMFKRGIALIGGGMVPMFDALANVIGGAFRGAITWLRENQELVKIIGVATAALAAFSLAVKIVGSVLSGVGVVLGIVGSAISALVGIVGFILTPLGAITAALVGIGIHIATTSDTIKDSFNVIGDTARTAFAGIMDSIKANDWGQALKIAGIGLKIVWKEIIGVLEQLWDGFIGWLEDRWEAIKTHFDMGGTNAKAMALKQAWANPVVRDGLIDAMPEFAGVERFEDIDARAEEINRLIDAKEEDDKAQRKAKRAAKLKKEVLDPLAAERKGLQGQLDDEVAKAAGKRLFMDAGGLSGLLAGGAFAGVKALPPAMNPGMAARIEGGAQALRKRVGEVRGTFESNQSVLGRIGFGQDKVDEEQLKVQKEMDKKLGKVAAAAAAGGIAFWK